MLCAGLLRRDRATTNDRGCGASILGCSAKDGRASRMARHCWRTWPRIRASEEGMSDLVERLRRQLVNSWNMSDLLEETAIELEQAYRDLDEANQQDEQRRAEIELLEALNTELLTALKWWIEKADYTQEDIDRTRVLTAKAEGRQ